MMRRVFGKLMWMGRATSSVVGIAILFALVIGAANSALAHTNVDNKLFHLGHDNPVGRLSSLSGVLGGALLKLDNNGTGPALLLEAGTDVPPLKVNAAAGTATGLSADELDGSDSTAFLPSRIYEVSATEEVQPGTGRGVVAYCDAGDLAVSGGYRDINVNLDIYLDHRVDENTDPKKGETHPAGWVVSASSPLGGSAGAVNTYAYCADLPPAHTG